jgi:hypothetical protein
MKTEGYVTKQNLLEIARSWKRVASVTPGGKPYFYFTRTPTELKWCFWDRIARRWKIEIETLTRKEQQ